ncbi:hypothetical protein KOR42_53890 [Thalassoglobus neptunius]|uniref:Uncharacterized protein n=1 Tax=Thalassoglobus neptunius TaxID=1938619 RepID=A0A5C5V185_9PLAN|nr:hypothetical protein [Thalassoglobus neptunius]TWT32161.1 hypothetical protein KOR42_53890 [Thalassoglobus neptunius]
MRFFTYPLLTVTASTMTLLMLAWLAVFWLHNFLLGHRRNSLEGFFALVYTGWDWSNPTPGIIESDNQIVVASSQSSREEG